MHLQQSRSQQETTEPERHAVEKPRAVRDAHFRNGRHIDFRLPAAEHVGSSSPAQLPGTKAVRPLGPAPEVVIEAPRALPQLQEAQTRPRRRRGLGAGFLAALGRSAGSQFARPLAQRRRRKAARSIGPPPNASTESEPMHR